jgi:hypothetical protein
MFGTIGRATLEPGQQAQLEALMQAWKQDIRPKIPGSVIELHGHRAGQPNEVVFIVLTQDEATYRQMAEMPEQHQFFLRANEALGGEPSWEDVELEWGIRE